MCLPHRNTIFEDLAALVFRVSISLFPFNPIECTWHPIDNVKLSFSSQSLFYDGLMKLVSLFSLIQNSTLSVASFDDDVLTRFVSARFKSWTKSIDSYIPYSNPVHCTALKWQADGVGCFIREILNFLLFHRTGGGNARAT